MSNITILVDWRKCDHLYKSLIIPLLPEIDPIRLGDGSDPSKPNIKTRKECAVCGAEWNDERQIWEAPQVARVLKSLSHPPQLPKA